MVVYGLMNDAYTLRLAAIERVLSEALPPEFSPSLADEVFGSLPDAPPRGGTAALLAPARELLSRGGKRWRPLLMLLSAGLWDAEAAALPLVSLVEFPHTGSLILDDIEDGSITRRGGPAVHRIYGEDAAINTGCFLYFLPLSRLGKSGLNADTRLALFGLYAEHLSRLHLGQALDIDWHRNDTAVPTEEEYLLMCRCKTGVLAGFAARAGAVIGRASEQEAALLGEAFEETGVAFQILDDVKNLKGGIAGKDRGDDIVEGKKSLPVILMLQENPDLAGRLREGFASARREGIGSPSVAETADLIIGSGAVDKAEKRARNLIENAKGRLESGFPSSAELDRLLGLIDFIG
jgi:octaprenyl-diphosphate synthase